MKMQFSNIVNSIVMTTHWTPGITLHMLFETRLTKNVNTVGNSWFPFLIIVWLKA